MKPAYERNQGCLPPKKRDLPVSSSAAGGWADGGGGEEAGHARSSDSAGREPLAVGSAPGEWIRLQPGAHYGVENADGLGVPIDQYGMLYKVALPSGAYPPTSLHPVLSHFSPAYSVPSSLLQHPGLPYPPLGYAHVPHSSLQLVGPRYAVPYAVPPGFVPPGSLLPAQPAVVPQAHHVPHLVPYPSVIQGGVVSSPPPPPAQTAAPGPAPSPSVLSQDQAATAARHHLAPAELHSRGAPVFYHHHAGSRTAQPGLGGTDYRDSLQEREKEVNGGEVEEERGGRDSVHSPQGPRAPHSAPPGPVEAQRPQDRVHRRFEARGSPGLHNTSDTDLEVQQVVSRLASPDRGVSGRRWQAAPGPLNLSQGSQREREEAPLGVRGEEEASAAGRIAHAAASPSGPDDDPRTPSLRSRPAAHHALLLAGGQPALVPPDYRQQQQRHPGPPDDILAVAAAAAASPKAFEPPAASYPPAQSPAPGAVQPAAAPPTGLGPSHFTKGAIIQLATGELKRVEDLQTQDFVRSAEASGGLKIDSSMVVDVRRSHRPGLVALHFTVGKQQSKVAIDVPPEHPFFVFGQGWSSCSPDATARLYGLDCHRLQAGDVCVSIALQQHGQTQSRVPAKAGSAPAVAFQPMGPPAPQQSRPPAHFRGDRPHRDREEEEEEEQGHVGEAPPRADGTPLEHERSWGAYRLHTAVPRRSGSAAAAASPPVPTAAAHRRCSAPGFQKYQIKSEEAPHPHPSPAYLRPTFIPQEVKLSIEGRSNAGK